MTTSYKRAIDAGFEAIEAAQKYGNAEAEAAIRQAMMALCGCDLLCSLRLGDPPQNPASDPRWYSKVTP